MARPQFLRLHLRDERWAVAVAHRRAGKTVACVNELITRAATCALKDGRYAYIAPQLNQAKDIAWSYLLEYSDGFEPARKVNASELWVELPNNQARIRLYGADNPDRLRGIYLDGVVMDEYGDMEPGLWSRVIRPLLADRGGWAIFIGTPKGKNQFHKLWAAAERRSRLVPADAQGLRDPHPHRQGAGRPQEGHGRRRICPGVRVQLRGGGPRRLLGQGDRGDRGGRADLRRAARPGAEGATPPGTWAWRIRR